jgi:hypothetical protein
MGRVHRRPPALAALAVGAAFAAAAAAGESAGWREEIQALREAYEGRIAALERQLKDVKTTAAAAQEQAGVRKRADQAIDEALAQRGLGADVKTAGRVFEIGAGNAVQGATQITLGGYTEFAYVDRGDKTAEFDQRRTVVELGAQISERLKLYMEVEYEHGAIIEGGEATGGELELEQAYLDYEINKALSFRAGMILVPIGRYNLYHEGFVNNFVDRPLVNRRIIGSTWFEEGVGFHGQALDKDWLGISYEAYLFNPGRAAGVSSGGGFRGIRNQGQAPTSEEKAGAARVAFEPARAAKWFADYLEIGVSGYLSGFDGFEGEDADGNELNLRDGSMYVTALDLTWEKKNFGFKGEMAFAHADSGANSTQRKQDGFGYYVEAYYKFWPKFLNKSPFGKDFRDPKLLATVRWEQVDLNLDSFDQRDMNRFTVGMGYRPVPNVLFKLDYQLDFSPSHRDGTTLGDSGHGRRTDAILFGVSAGF